MIILAPADSTNPPLYMRSRSTELDNSSYTDFRNS